MQLTIDDIEYAIPIMDDGALLGFVEAVAALQIRDSMTLSDTVGLLILSEAMNWGLTQDQLSANAESIVFAYLAANMGLQRLLIAVPDQYEVVVGDSSPVQAAVPDQSTETTSPEASENA